MISWIHLIPSYGTKNGGWFYSILDRSWGKLDDPMNAFAKKMIETPKIVFTKTLNKSEWTNTEIATGNLKDEIINLKSLEW